MHLILRNAARLSLGELGSRIPLLLLELMLARTLGPVLYGIWSVIQTFATYGNFLHLGVASALARREPGLLGRREFCELRAARAATYGLQIAIVASVTAIILALSASDSFSYNSIGGVATAVAILLVILAQQITITSQASGINEYKLLEASIARLVYAFTFLAIGIVVVKYQPPLLWLTLGWAAALFTGLAVFHFRNQNIMVPPTIDLARVTDLLKDGYPIMLQGLLRFALMSIDRLTVFAVARPESIGYYGMGCLVASVTGLCATIVSRVSLPTLLRLHGEVGRAIEMMAEFRRMSVLIHVLTYLVLLTVCSVSPLIIHCFMPAFQPAMHVIGLLALAGGFAGLAQAMSDVAISVGAKAAVLLNTAITLIVQGGLLALSWQLGAGIEGIAGAVLLTMMLMYIRSLWLALRALDFDLRTAKARITKAFLTAVVLVALCLAFLDLQTRGLSELPIGTLFAITFVTLSLVFGAIAIGVARGKLLRHLGDTKGADYASWR